MKHTPSLKLLFGLLFVSLFVSSCYTQLAVVKRQHVVVREKEYSYEDQQEDTVYVDEDDGDQKIVVYHEYEDYPYHVTIRHRFYDPFWDDYYWDDYYYYAGWHRPYYYPYDYYWYRPVVYYSDPWYWGGYYGGGWYAPVYVKNHKPRNFARGTGIRHTAARGASLGRGSRTPSVTSRDRVAKSRVVSSRGDDARAVSIRTGQPATTVQKRGTRSETRRTVKSDGRTTRGKKYIRSGSGTSKRVSRATRSKSSSKSRVQKSRSSDSSRSNSEAKSSRSSGSRSSSGSSYGSSRSSSSSSGGSVSKSRGSSSRSSSNSRGSSRSSGSSRRR